MTRSAVLGAVLLLAAATAPAQSLFDLPPGVETRWYSFENPSGRRGEGGPSQAGRKGAASTTIHAGETVVLADVAGPGVVRRIWMTVPGRVDTLRGWVVRVYWDGQDWASVEAPLQDFFGLPFARQVPFESALFSNPEGRSFNSVVPMPFRQRARLTVTNESPEEASLFYDVDVTIGDALPADLGYFHARYRRENPTTTASGRRSSAPGRRTSWARRGASAASTTSTRERRSRRRRTACGAFTATTCRTPSTSRRRSA